MVSLFHVKLKRILYFRSYRVLKVWMKYIFPIRWSIKRVESNLLVEFDVFYQRI